MGCFLALLYLLAVLVYWILLFGVGMIFLGACVVWYAAMGIIALLTKGK